MPVGKKLSLVLSVMIIGGSAALFFRKDASPLWFWSRRSDDPFAQQVERRVGQPAWTPPGGGAAPPLATASIEQPGLSYDPADARPVGSLLAPIEGVADDFESGRYEARPRYQPTYAARPEPIAPVAPPVYLDTAGTDEIRHRVQDGDTLTKLAVQYLGRADGYREIYEHNRAILANPDLLPIGAVLRIPRRASAPYESTGMVPVPPRPGT